MGQKSNPISLRLQYNNLNFDSNWYSDFYYAQCLLKNISLQEYSRSFVKLLKLPEARLNLNLGVKSMKLYSFFCIPQLTRYSRSRKFRIQGNLSSSWMHKKTKTRKDLNTQSLSNNENINTINTRQKPLTLLENPSFSKIPHFAKNPNIHYLLQNIQYLETQNNLSEEQKTFLKEQQFKLKYFLLQYFSFYKGMNLLEAPNQNSNDNNNNNPILTKKDFYQFLDITALSLPTLENKKLSLNETIQLQGLTTNNKFQNYMSNFHSTNSLMNQSNPLNFQYVPFNLNNDLQGAGFLADEIVYFLEKKVSFSRIKNRIFKEVESLPYIRGIRIKYSGRVGGKSKKAQRAKHECVKYGQTSLHVFDHQIDYASRTAATSFGSVGIKVWICYK